MVNKEGRKCNRCGFFKTWHHFAVNSKGLNGHKSICKECSNKSQRELTKRRREEDPEKWSRYRREKGLKSKYGLSLEDFDRLLKEQDYQCKICGKQDNAIGDHMYVDHCHATGKVRGLLCSHCNSGLGMFNDCTYLLSKAIKYIEENEG